MRQVLETDLGLILSPVACHRFGLAGQVPPPSHLFSQATAIGEDESGSRNGHAASCGKLGC